MREHNREVNFVVKADRTLTAIEVKSCRVKELQPGMVIFQEKFQPDQTLLLGEMVSIQPVISLLLRSWPLAPINLRRENENACHSESCFAHGLQ